MASAAAKVTVSRAILAQLLPGRLASGAHVVYNVVAFRTDFDRLQKLSKLRQHAAANFTFCILGLISPAKGQVEAIRAFARVAAKHENVSLVVAGSGEEEDVRSCIALADRLGLRGKVKFTGYVADPFPLLAQADAVLVCSKVEAMGRVSAEAMAARKPVISYANDGALELIEHGINGLLYSSGAEELANYMLRLIEDQSLSSRIALAGWEGARGNYTIEKYAGTIHDIYLSILQDYPRKQGLARA